MHKFLILHSGDHVGIVVADIKKGEVVEGVIMDRDKRVKITSLSDIPLGQKIALRDFAVGVPVIKHGIQVGLTTEEIKAGEWVHNRNLRLAKA